MGSYHGRHTFDQLSHLRSCLIKQLKMERVNAMRYPPHTAKKMGWARFFLLQQVNVCRLQRMALLATLIGLAAFVVQVINLLLHSAQRHRPLELGGRPSHFCSRKCVCMCVPPSVVRGAPTAPHTHTPTCL